MMFAKAIGLILGALIFTGIGAYGGYRLEEGKFADLKASDAQAAANALQAALTLQKRQNATTNASEVASIKAQQQIKTVTQTIIKKVPIYVTAQTDSRFPLPCGFVRLHDAAALGVDPATIPNPTGKSDGDACEVTASEAATIIAENYGSYASASKQLTDLQAWIIAEHALADSNH